MSDMGRIRAILDRLAADTEPPCQHIRRIETYRDAVDQISRIAYPEETT